MRELINGKAVNVIMLLISFLFFMFSAFGNITIKVKYLYGFWKSIPLTTQMSCCFFLPDP